MTRCTVDTLLPVIVAVFRIEWPVRNCFTTSLCALRNSFADLVEPAGRPSFLPSRRALAKPELMLSTRAYFGSVQESRDDAPMRISFTHTPDLDVEQDLG